MDENKPKFQIPLSEIHKFFLLAFVWGLLLGLQPAFSQSCAYSYFYFILPISFEQFKSGSLPHEISLCAGNEEIRLESLKNTFFHERSLGKSEKLPIYELGSLSKINLSLVYSPLNLFEESDQRGLFFIRTCSDNLNFFSKDTHIYLEIKNKDEIMKIFLESSKLSYVREAYLGVFSFESGTYTLVLPIHTQNEVYHQEIKNKLVL
ncbi:MAG: hypothetical protein NW226_12845 [Microscillaceae bacterium]|nr:hypothetical protein [Microscillaceae bacterium]